MIHVDLKIVCPNPKILAAPLWIHNAYIHTYTHAYIRPFNNM